MSRPLRPSRFARHAMVSSLLVGTIATLGGGCLDRPVSPATPKITARVQEKVPQSSVDKIDILFMIDNSSSMKDKQDVLAEAVPDLVESLIQPRCVTLSKKEDGTTTRTVVGKSDANLKCAQGEIDFNPVNDIHIGVISSSLGDLGVGALCKDDSHGNDKGHLLRRVKEGSPIAADFLNWNPKTNQGQTLADLKANFARVVSGVEQDGCGYEMQLESVYRFLNDPAPYDHIEGPTPGGVEPAKLVGKDDVLLKQRAAFLRPDSLVAIVNVSDENDCSLIPGGQNYVVFNNNDSLGSGYPRGTTACDQNPADKCCFNCRITDDRVPAGCTAPKDDPVCDPKKTRGKEDDPRNLRCFDQKRKYGAELLYPIQRYVDAARSPKIKDRSGNDVNNPLYSDLLCEEGGSKGCKPPRDPSLVFYAMIVGVPWQDLAREPKSIAAGYLSAKELRDNHQWEKIVMPVGTYEPPSGFDPLMIESVAARSGENPFTQDKIAQPGVTGLPNAINGHEWATDQIANSPYSDLQFACIFPLPTPKDCAADAANCDCANGVDKIKNPLCWDDAAKAYSTKQTSAKAYPGVRQLQVLQKLSETNPDQAIPASICPADLTNPAETNTGYGYRPAVAAILERLRVVLNGTCLPRQLAPDCEKGITADDKYGTVPCVVIEASNPDNNAECCTRPGRQVADPKLVPSDATDLRCKCQVNQLFGSQLSTCQNDVNDSNAAFGGKQGDGWCYVDNDLYKTEPSLVQNCTDNAKRIIRFVGEGKPASGSVSYITCQEAGFNPSDPVTGVEVNQADKKCKDIPAVSQ